jgi:two-component system response regulator HydG
MTAAPSILVVDDDAAHRTMLATLLGSWGYRITEAGDGGQAVEAVRQQVFDLILMDVRMIQMSGIEALERIKTINPAISVVLMTAYASVETAVEAIRKGAYDYLTKPLDFDKLRLTMQRAMEHLRLQAENRQLKADLGRNLNRPHIIGHSPAMGALLETVAQVAPTEATVLITGESGTGKELIAAAIHDNSLRRHGPLVKINCAAITETLLESELFGHEKGAFTGADRRKEGRIVQAHGGSMFLDEVGEMPLTMQVKLLRAIQEREVVRVGGQESVAVDVRIIAATNRDLTRMIADGTFRQDLYYRLNVGGLHIPPLRERTADIPLLAVHFLTRFADKNRKAIQGFTPAAMDRLIRHSWPGNVRELANAVERAVVLGRGAYLDEADFLEPTGPAMEAPVALPEGPLSELERQAILRTLEATGGNKSEAARRLGITRKTLHQKLKQYDGQTP